MKHHTKLVLKLTKLPKQLNLRFYSKLSQKFVRSSNMRVSRPTIERRTVDPDYVPEEQSLIDLLNKHTAAEETMYEAVDVKVEGALEPPTPVESLKEANFSSKILFNASKVGISKLTPIQKYSFPIVAQKKDIMACSQTGSGKTLAFMLPIIDNILKTDQKRNRVLPRGLIIAPTRELANQIYDECRKFSAGTSIKACVAFGGVSINAQIDKIGKGCDILIGTPGRIKDLLLRGITSLSHVDFLVLDEADRMLDMGFERDIRSIVSEEFEIKDVAERTTLLFSATFPKEIRELAQDFLKEDHFFITVGRVGGTTNLIDQQFVDVKPFEKMDKLSQHIKKGQKTLIFVNAKVDATRIEEELSRDHRVTSIHGDKTQRQRDVALSEFKNQKVDVLVATDVASRGLDINDIEVVFNYELPNDIDSYVHRIGRTARKGKSGKAISFVSRYDSILKDLVSLLKQNEKLTIPSFLLDYTKSNVKSNSTPRSQRSTGPRTVFSRNNKPKSNRNSSSYGIDRQMFQNYKKISRQSKSYDDDDDEEFEKYRPKRMDFGSRKKY